MTDQLPCVNLRKSHPALFRQVLRLGFGEIALAVNFWLTTPTFDPFGVNKNIVAVVFAMIGLILLASLMWFRNLRVTRIMLAVSVGWMMFWGLGNTQQFFNGKASLQLPILCVLISLLMSPLLTESPVNPFTEKK